MRLDSPRDAIVILEKVFFETNKAIIKPESFPLLNEVAAAPSRSFLAKFGVHSVASLLDIISIVCF